MGLGFVLLFWLAVIAALGLVWMASLGLTLFALAKRSRVLLWLGGVPLVASSLGTILWALLLMWAVALAIYSAFQ